MCGLVGIYGKELSMDYEKAFKYMLYFDQFRGEHSTGVMIASKSYVGDVTATEVVKTLGSPSELYAKHGKFQGKTSLTSKGKLFCLLGHNRYATQGGISEETAHPFDMGEVIGAHNGTVLKYTLEDLFEAKEYQVDSQRIYSHLGQGNPITDVWKVADGAMALTWFNKNDNKLRIIRNKERPLFTALTKDKKYIFWSSEPWMMIVGAQLSKIEIEEPTLLKENLLQEISINEEGLIHIEETEIPPFVKKAYTYTTGHYSRNFYGWDDDLDDVLGGNKEEKPSKNPLEFHITEVHKHPQFPKAFGLTLDGKTVVQISLPTGPRGTNLLNNILQRGKRRGYYISNEYWDIISDGKKAFFTNMDKVVYVKKKTNFLQLPTVKGFGAVNLSHEQFERAVQCGCLNCNGIPKFINGNDCTWVSHDEFICGECMSLPWIQEFIDQYSQQRQQA